MFAVLVGILALLILLALTSDSGNSRLAEPRVVAAWLIHPDGIIVRTGSTSRHIPRAKIKRIDRRESLFGSISQLMIILHMWSDGPVLASTRILYIEGTDDERLARWQRAREVLGLAKPAAAEPQPTTRK